MKGVTLKLTRNKSKDTLTTPTTSDDGDDKNNKSDNAEVEKKTKTKDILTTPSDDSDGASIEDLGTPERKIKCYTID